MVMLGVKKYRDYKWYNLHEEKVKKTIKKISQENTKKITISKGRLFSWFILEDNYYPYKNLDVLKNAKSTSEDIYVFILVNKRNAEKWNRIANRKSTSKDQTENKFRDFANNHSFKKLKIKDINLFYKKIEKGSVNITRDQKN
jgi:hypothetical protein